MRNRDAKGATSSSPYKERWSSVVSLQDLWHDFLGHSLWLRIRPVSFFPKALDGGFDDLWREAERGLPGDEANEALVGEVDRVRLEDVGGSVGGDGQRV